MKIKLLALPLLAALALYLPVAAADQAHDHQHAAKTAGPNGGRLLTALEPHAEFFVTADRKVRITFLDENDRPVPPSGQSVTVTAGDRAAPTRLTFVRAGDVLISDGPLPAGNNFPAVVQIKPAADTKTVVVRFNVNLSLCPDCRHAEYACLCDEHDHAH